MNNNNNRFSRTPRKPDHGYALNEQIKAQQVRIVGDNVEPKVCSLSEALAIAAAQSLDLVEITAGANPPVVKVMDFQKFYYEKRKKEKELKHAQKNVTTKEIRLGHNIGDHDLDFKVKHSIEFLQKGHKVKAYIQFRGREITYKDRGEIVMLKFLQAIEDYGKPEFLPKMEGKVMYVIITPKK